MPADPTPRGVDRPGSRTPLRDEAASPRHGAPGGTPAAATGPGSRAARTRTGLGGRVTALVLSSVLTLTAALTLGAVASGPASAVGPFDGAPTMLNQWGAGTLVSPPAGLTDSSRVIVDVAAGWDHALAVTSDGRLWAWGDNSQGQSVVPASLKDGSYKAVAAGAQFSVALTTDGKVVAWGTNWAKQVTVPAIVKNRTIVAISAGTAHVVAQADDGRLFAWGDDDFQEGSIPAWVQSAGVVTFDAGGVFNVATTADRKVIAWGDNSSHQLEVPASLAGKNVEEISAGTRHVLALTDDGKVTAWGDNSAGELDLPTESAGDRWQHVSAGNDLSVGTTNRRSIPQVWGKTTGIPAAPFMSYAPSTVDAGDGFALTGYARLIIADVGSLTGSGRVGEPLTGSFGSFSPLDATTKTGRWRVYEGGATAGTGQTYVPRPEDVGKRILFDTVGTREGYNLSSGVGSPSIVISPGVMTTSAPRLEGEAKVGKVLQAAVDVVPHSDDVWFDWHWGGEYRKTSWDGRLEVPAEALGQVITVKVTAKQPGYLDAYAGEISTSTIVVAADPDPGEDPTEDPTQDPDPGHDPGGPATFAVSRAVAVTGSARVGQVLTAKAPTTTPSGTVTYQWLRGGTAITKATKATYRLVAADRGARITVRAVVARTGYTTLTQTSAPTAAVAKASLRARTTAKAAKRKGKRAVVRVTVRTSVTGVKVPRATVVVTKGGRTLAKGRLKAGKTVLRLRLPRGKHRVVVRVKTTATTTATKVPVRVRVR